MTDTLAIFTPKIGERSETFIKRHIDSILPGRTVVIAGSRAGATWQGQCPILILDELPTPRFAKVLFRAILEKAGWRRENPEIRAVREFLRQHKVTVAMGEYLDSSILWLEVCRNLGIRFYGHAHGYDVSILLRQEHWRKVYLKYRDAAGIIAVSQASRARLIDLGLAAESIQVIPCGVEVEERDTPGICSNHRLDRREREAHVVTAVPGGRAETIVGLIRCLAVGRMVSKKSPIFCLDAFRRAVEKVPALRLTYVGAGELLPAARHFVKAFGLGDKVSLLGGQPHEVVEQLLTESDVFIQHSIVDQDSGDEEGLPVGILEAMAHGLPVISTRHAGIPDAVVHQGTGLLVEEGDSEGMANCLVKLANDAELRRSMGHQGWRRAKELFTWERERDSLQRIMGLGSTEL